MNKVFRGGMRKSAALTLSLALVLGVGCKTTSFPVGNLEIPVPDLAMLKDNPRDFRGLSWSGAFNAAIIQMQKDYAYDDWKDVNWERLRSKYSDRIAEAEETKNDWAYYMALRDFATSMRDGLVDIPAELGYKRRDLGGGYGISFLPLQDNVLMVSEVDSGRHSLAGSVLPGAKLVGWDKQSAWEALENTPIAWSQPPPASDYGALMARAELLGRAPIGSTTTVSFQNPGRGDEMTAELTAILDDGDTNKGTVTDGSGIVDFASPFDSKITNGFGYLKINFLGSTLAMPFPPLAFQNHLQRLIDDGMQGLIIDLRGNSGGDSALPPKLLGHFVEFETFYRDFAYRNATSGKYGLRMDERESIEAVKPMYKGPIVVLVDSKTFGAAESMAYALRQLPRSRVVGFTASQGTADVPTADIIMPGSYRISYPIARAVDINGKVIITTNDDGVGGVQPDVLVPLNLKNATDFYVKGIDVVMIEAVRVLQQGI